MVSLKKLYLKIGIKGILVIKFCNGIFISKFFKNYKIL